MATTITWHDTSAQVIRQDKMTPGEIGAIERELAKEFGDKTLTFGKLRRMGDTCVCDHKSATHRHKDAAGDIDPSNTACDECDCDKHEPNLSPLVQVAYMWVSLRRVNPSLRWSDVRDSPIADFDAETSDDEADPTLPLAEAPTT